MSRVQLALNVADLDEAVRFYSRLLGSEPAKLRPGYANFAVADPPLKLVLIADRQQVPGSLNHLGIEVEGPEAVAVAGRRLGDAGLAPADEDGVTCCYALQDKVWVEGPGGEAWEIYTVLADSDTPAGPTSAAAAGAPACCASRPDLAAVVGPTTASCR
jgi:catechol 2,3-dioxygenase-like lactoylglutathione lyase family enzyme